MSGISAAQGKIRHLSKQSVDVQLGRKISVVYFDENGQIDWPPNCNSDVLSVPRPVSLGEWIEKHGSVR